MATTLKDIAEQLGLSKATVSKALTGSSEVSVETQRRVLAAAQALQYHTNLAAKGLRFQRSRMVGVVLDKIDNEFGSRLAAGIQNELQRCGYQALVISANRELSRERAAVTSLLEHSVDGIILADTQLRVTDELPSRMLELELPVVCVDRHVTQSHVPFICPDNQFGGYQATEHLIAHGHERIAHIAGPLSWDASVERRAGCLQALRDYGRQVDDSLVVEGDWSPASGRSAGLELLKRADRPTAIFTANDGMASGIYDAAHELGLSIPGDLAVVGFDDLQMASYLRPALTTVRAPMKEMGIVAAAVLIDRIQGREPASSRMEMRVRGQLVYRSSCGQHAESAEGGSKEDGPRKWGGLGDL